MTDQTAPSTIEPPPAPPRGRAWMWLAAAILVLGGAGGVYWWLHSAPGLPPGLAFSNGRLEADEIDIATRFPGRIAEILAEEGDIVHAGQVVARMDTRDLEVQVAQTEAQILQAQHTVVGHQADLMQQRSALGLAEQEFKRARVLVAGDAGTRELLEQRESQLATARAGYRSIEAQIAAARAALRAVTHSGELIRVNIADNTLVASKDGPIQYRLANIGEVLPAGGKVFTLLDLTYVYMDIFLPTDVVGKVQLGDEARILLDALPNRPIPALVSFIASENQFTPKMVETQSERDKLMFRVRVRIDPTLLRQGKVPVRSGLPGLAYIRVDRNTPWPTFLQTGASK
jgi:HlyD family secretion protein